MDILTSDVSTTILSYLGPGEIAAVIAYLKAEGAFIYDLHQSRAAKRRRTETLGVRLQPFLQSIFSFKKDGKSNSSKRIINLVAAKAGQICYECVNPVDHYTVKGPVTYPQHSDLLCPEHTFVKNRTDLYSNGAFRRAVGFTTWPNEVRTVYTSDIHLRLLFIGSLTNKYNELGYIIFRYKGFRYFWREGVDAVKAALASSFDTSKYLTYHP
eukprot:gb/GEZN01010856.1/.p1 GENE.gb/GEZN01010856.1/~~gb/GEZN01010856.1/.p1  ORF type:complete len:221 (-),score=11.85 gb/GEZN01010856.1/:544-1179(-)